MNSPIVLTPTLTASALTESGFVHFDGHLYAEFVTGTFASGLELVGRIGQAAEEANHHPDVRLSYGSVAVDLSSHDAGGVTDRDVRLAIVIHRIAREVGLSATGAFPGRYDVAIDCTDTEAIKGFWLAALNYVETTGENGIELIDPIGVGPRIWFQHMEIARTDRNRIHLDSYVPAADAEERVAAIIAAGGTLVTDEFAPDWWVMADVEGNEMCVCSSTN